MKHDSKQNQKQVLTLEKKYKKRNQFSCSVMSDSSHSTPGLPVHHQLPESTQTHVH